VGIIKDIDIYLNFCHYNKRNNEQGNQKMNKKQDLLNEMDREHDIGFISWVTTEFSDDYDAESIWRRCPSIEWAIRFAARRYPKSMVGFTQRCSNRATTTAETVRIAFESADYQRRGLYNNHIELAHHANEVAAAAQKCARNIDVVANALKASGHASSIAWGAMPGRGPSYQSSFQMQHDALKAEKAIQLDDLHNLGLWSLHICTNCQTELKAE
jgi:hypothetical protein